MSAWPSIVAERHDKARTDQRRLPYSEDAQLRRDRYVNDQSRSSAPFGGVGGALRKRLRTALARPIASLSANSSFTLSGATKMHLRLLLVAAVIAGFALAHGIAVFQINSTSPGAGSESAPLLTRGD
jgi:hypothetical protein